VNLLWQAAVSGGFDPLSLGPSLYLDFQSGGFTTEAGGRITQWDDLSGNDNHATAASGSAARPTLGSDGVDFVDNALTTPSFAISPPITTILVGNISSPAAYLFSAAVTTSKPGIYIADPNIISIASPNVTWDVTSVTGEYILTRINTTATVQLYKSGTEYPAQAQTFPTVYGICLGRRGYDGTAPATMTLYHFSLFPYALTDAQRKKYERYLAKKYGVVL
jgi:hypothetical protein